MKTRTIPKWPIDADEIRRLARQGGLSVRQLAGRSGVDETSLYKYLGGQRDAGLDEVAVLAHELSKQLRRVVSVEDITAKPCARCGTVRQAAA